MIAPAQEPGPAGGMTVPAEESNGMRLLGQHDLGGRGNCGEGTALLEHGGRRYLYLAHEQGPANFSVLDVTDPAAPELLTQTTLPHGDVRSNSLALGDGRHPALRPQPGCATPPDRLPLSFGCPRERHALHPFPRGPVSLPHRGK